jgi:hypothetical protein
MAIIPYKRANVASDQPWMDGFGDVDSISQQILLSQYQERGDLDTVVLQSKIAAADDGDRQAIVELYPLLHYILTTDFRIVEEPNFLRWGIFMEKADHRQIDLTEICNGVLDRYPRAKESRAPQFRPEKAVVSTVFIGADLKCLFQTMIMGGLFNGVYWYHDSLSDAKTRHWKTVDMMHKFNRYMKRHGKSFRKDWIRLDKTYKLVNIRGFSWLCKRIETFESLYNRLSRVPGPPPVPQPSIVHQLAQMFTPRKIIC